MRAPTLPVSRGKSSRCLTFSVAGREGAWHACIPAIHMTSDVSSQGTGQASEVDFVALKPGQTIGRYEIVAILGQGGFGITYRARDSQLHREVAIKEFLPSALAIRQGDATVLPRSTKMADDFTWGRQRFVDEGRTLATLQRAPGIVRV